ncbi:MAG: transcriptional regulator [Pigmentiphaga sp.]|uniref:PhaM family polyhydroxyalkanoate granule multifunctional regulatory protein n=1 Tax=Pigmentiphaga sp. TaxID=1977564 RepID=UPI00299FD81B|nr:PhaM family polyhydroxyalkanoate granule multifunctional regulatory protein [Pigmentiphaga sp.]MDX3907050.1 transcriptional regulator [Pigmentiphaga sp.]
MASQSANASGPGNPFGIPGMQLPGGDANIANPVLQSMEMMRQVWNSLTTLSQTAPVSPSMGLDELDRRITDLRAIENWLNLNLAMLRGSIQGLEVQRATISTLRSFVQTANVAQGDTSAPAAPPSPLEVALGLRRPPAGDAAADAAGTQAEKQGASSGEQDESAAAGTRQPDPSAAGLWWNLLQDQFQRMAAAASSMPGAPRPADPAPAPQNKKTARAPSNTRKAAAKRTANGRRSPKPKA